MRLIVKRSTAALIPALLVSLSPRADAQGLPVYTGSSIPVAIWVIGTIVLGCVIAYGIVHTKNRSRVEKQRTEQGTKEVYRQEERDRVNKGLQ
jgi:hypothetical protein